MSVVSESEDIKSKCNSCGVPWVDHRGPTLLCEKIQECKRVIKDLLHYVEQPEYMRDIGEMEVYYDLIEDAEIIIKEF